MLSKKLLLAFCVGLVVIFVLLPISGSNVFSAISACTATVSPTDVSVSGSPNLSFTVANSDSSTAVAWIKATSPSANFTVTSASANGWSTSTTSTTATFTGSLPASASGEFVVSVSTGSSTASAASWTVETSSSSDGSGPTTCTGSTSVAISAAVDEAGPAISNIVISDISDSQAKITWTTDENATTSLAYGTSNSYGSTATDSTSTTSHSITLTNLSANTTYHVNITNTDGTGNTGESGDFTFVTAKAGTTTTTTKTVTETKTVTKTVKDTTAPSVSLTADFKKPYEKAPEILGKATDSGGVARVEYSIDNGKNWTPVDSIKGEFTDSVTFTFTPQIIDDDDYKVKVRAYDSTGNVSTSPVYTLTIDRLPPAVGATILTVGPQILEPDENGVMTTVAGITHKIILSAVGGPTSIEIASSRSVDTNVTRNDKGNQIFSLTKNLESGLWSGELSFEEPGIFRLQAVSRDGAGNVTQRQLQTVAVLQNGKVTAEGDSIKNSRITVYFQEPSTKQFVSWNASAYSQTNPQELDGDGGYKFFLPPGTYYLEVNAPGAKTQRTAIFKIDKNLPVNTNFILKGAVGFKVGKFTLSLPAIFNPPTEVTLALPTITQAPKSELIDREFPDFSLFLSGAAITNLDLRTKPTIISFINSFSPNTFEQIAVLDKLSDSQNLRVVAIFPQESVSKIEIVRRRGAYKTQMTADPDGTLVEPLGLSYLPTHVFVNRKGVVTGVKLGVLNEHELLEGLVN